jgi:hypothetical protein
MSEVSLMLQAAVIAALKNDAPFNAALGERLYDAVPPKPVFPYVTFRMGDVIGDGADCVDGNEVYFDLHVWSRAIGWPEAANAAGIIRDALDEAELSITDHSLVNLHFRTFRRLEDQDGITHHGVITFRALIDAV